MGGTGGKFSGKEAGRGPEHPPTLRVTDPPFLRGNAEACAAGRRGSTQHCLLPSQPRKRLGAATHPPLRRRGDGQTRLSIGESDGVRGRARQTVRSTALVVFSEAEASALCDNVLEHTERVGGVGTGETHSAFGKGIHVRRVEAFSTHDATHAVRKLLISHDNEDIGTFHARAPLDLS